VPLITRDIENETFTLSVVEVESGERQIITESACFGSDISPDGLTIGYALCQKEGSGYRSELRIHHMESGSERSLGTVPGRARDLHLSPGGGRMAARAQERIGEEETPRTFVATGVGDPVRFEGWCPIGWSDPERVFLGQQWEKVRFALADVRSGRIEEIFP
jgi:hypothetical protein